MNFLDWVPAISTTSLLGGALWLLRSIISTRLTKSVQHEFDNKIETLRTNLRKSEESFKADLRTKEAQIAALHGGALAGMTTRLAALDRRRIEAVDQLWSAVTALSQAKGISASMSIIKLEPAAKETARNPQAREIFEVIGRHFEIQKLQTSEASKARPFVSELAWALFSAYEAIVAHAVIKLEILKTGIDGANIIDTPSIEKVIKAALPHRTEYVDKHGDGAYHHLLDELESCLLEELRKMLQGVDSDKATVAQAAEIVRESEHYMRSISQSGLSINGEPIDGAITRPGKHG